MTFASQSLDVNDTSQVSEVRRAACATATAASLDAARAHEAGIVATELATNLLKHARGGSMLVQRGWDSGLDLISLDRGPGMASFGVAMRDGFSTAGTPGNGLGAVSRLASVMDVYSVPGSGTALYAHIGPGLGRASEPRSASSGRGGFEAGAVSVALRGESVCGDSFAVHDGPQGCLVLVADGLGHGPLAAEASRAAIAAFGRSHDRGVTGILAEAHNALRSTRGAAVAVAHVHAHLGTVRYCGVGNIVGALLSGDTVRRMVSHNGTTGVGTPRMTEFQYPWASQGTLIMHSDGVGTKWDLAKYPGLAARHPTLIAAVLLRDFARERDDATVVVVREART